MFSLQSCFVFSFHLSIVIDTAVAAVVGVFTTVLKLVPKFRVNGGGIRENLALQNVQVSQLIVEVGQEILIVDPVLVVCMILNRRAFNPFPNKPWFLCVCSTSPLKTLQEKEKLLVTSSFCFSHSVFYPFGELFAIFIKFKIVVCKLFQVGRV